VPNGERHLKTAKTDPQRLPGMGRQTLRCPRLLLSQ
jgi:hypothetical protein